MNEYWKAPELPSGDTPCFGSDEEVQADGKSKPAFLTVNGVTFVAPEPAPLEDGQLSVASSFVISGKKCPRCQKFLSTSQTSVGGQAPIVSPLPSHTEEECSMVIVDEVHDR